MILSSNLVQLNGITKLWTFEGEESKRPKRQDHTLILYLHRSDIKYTVTHFQQKRYPDPTYQQRKENTNESHVKYVV